MNGGEPIRVVCMVSLALVVALFAGCGAPEEIALRGDLEHRDARFVPNIIDRTDFASFGLLQRIPLDTTEASVEAGAFTESVENEIVLVDGDELRVLDARGELQSTFELAHSSNRLGPRADVSGDGATDIILGGRSEGSVRLTAYDRRGNLLFDHSDGEMPDGETYPHFLHEDRLYFSSHALYKTRPRSTGYFDPGEEAFHYYLEDDDVVIRDVSLSEAGTLALSHRAAGRDIQRDPHDMHRTHDFFLFDRGGEELIRTPITAETEAGFFGEDQASSVEIRAFREDDEDGELFLTAIQRQSDLYDASPRLDLRRSDGTVVASVDGPRASEASFAWYPNADCKREVVVLWTRTGEIERFDEELNRIDSGSVELTPAPARDAHLLQAGRFVDGNIGFLVADDRYVAVLDHELRIASAWEFPSIVREATVVARGDRATVSVVADALYVLGEDGDPLPEEGSGPDWLEPAPRRVPDAQLAAAPAFRSDLFSFEPGVGAGDEQRINRDRVQPPMVAEKPLELNAEGGWEQLTPDRGAPIDESVELEATPLGSDGRSKYVFASQESGWIEVRTADFELYARWRTPDLLVSTIVPVGDVTGDGRDEIYYSRNDSFDGYIATLGGRTVFRTRISDGFDGSVSFGRWDGARLGLLAETGYLLMPRGVYMIDPAEQRIEFFYATANRWGHRRIIEQDGRFHLGSFTPHNGAVLEHNEGAVETDTNLYVHVFDRDGGKLPVSGPRPEPYHAGFINPMAIDDFSDYDPAVYYVDRKLSEYYPGTPYLYRFEQDSGELIPIVEGPENARGSLRARLLVEGEELLAVGWSGENGFVDLLDRRLTPVDRLDGLQFSLSAQRIADFTADGNSELVGAIDERVWITDIRGNAHYVHEADGGGSMQSVFVDDFDGDGRIDILVEYEDFVELLKY